VKSAPSLPATLVVCLLGAAPLAAQTPSPLVGSQIAGGPPAAAPRIDQFEPSGSPGPPVRERAARPAMPGFGEPFRQYAGDLRRFLSPDTFRVVGIGGAVALAANRVDGQTVLGARERLQPVARFSTGNVGGGALVQAGAAMATLAIGKMTGQSTIAWVGADLVRAQLVSQTFVQGLKFATGRGRPDGSNSQSFPSGHTASAAATATVLQRHFGWKAGVPAYAFAAYVGAARMSADKHHLSDVLMGATIGIAAGRSVTVGLGGQRFSVGVAPTVGGAAVTFTRQ
jgi:membrane-associated phospholipid phosphatase